MIAKQELVVTHSEHLDPNRGQETPERGNTGKGEKGLTMSQ